MLRSFREQVLWWEREQNEKNAICYLQRKNRKTVSYIQLANDIRKCSSFIQKMCKEHCNIALMGDNSYELVVAFWSIICAGKTVVWINKNLDAADVLEKMQFTEAKMVFYDDDSYDLMEEVQGYYSVPAYILEEKVYEDTEPLAFEGEEDVDVPAMLMFTSGSTGVPKAVMMSQTGLLTSVEGKRSVYNMEGSFLVAAPIHHMYAISFMLQALYEERELHLCTVRTMLRSLAILKSDYAAMIASMQNLLLQCIEETEQGKEILDGPLKYICTGASVPNPATVQKLKGYGYIVQNDYGMSETQCIGIYPDDGIVPEGAKRVFDQIQIKIVGGEIMIKAPSNALGYYKNPEMTEKLFDDGWVHTGDLGYLDENGYLYLTGRCKNLIILDNGENVSPEEIEKKLMDIEQIREVIVCAMDNKICAKIVPEAENLKNCDEIKAQIEKAVRTYNEGAATYNQIRKILFMEEEFKKVSVGKIVR